MRKSPRSRALRAGRRANAACIARACATLGRLSTLPLRHPRGPKETASGRLVRLLALLALLCVVQTLRAEPVDLAGRWTQVSEGTAAHTVARPRVTGGRYVFESVFQVSTGGRYVIDFRNGHVLGRFEHRLADASGTRVLTAEGGLQGDAENGFFLRHGREFELAPGTYHLRTTLRSPYFIAPPEPYLDTLEHYRRAIQPGNALSLMGLGVFIGLGVYYACLALARERRTEGLYALFIAGNLAFNAGSLGIAQDLFGVRWFHLTSVPILFSNIAYVAFVMSLLRLRHTAPRLARTGRGVMALMGALALGAAWQPGLALEAARAGVALFLGFGLLAGISRARAGDRLARWYLVANGAFALAGGAAITLADMGHTRTITVEHVGLVAVAVEVLLLGLVLAYQFRELQRSSAEALASAERNLALALTDPLTGLPNRHALEIALQALPAAGSLTFIDLDGLKRYNDRYGHAEGDRLLREFGRALKQRLEGLATLHRLGGDEFVALARGGEVAAVEAALQETVRALQLSGYDMLGASCGSVRCGEAPDVEALQILADMRMYEQKHRRQAERALQEA